jgi:hypothetical protein
VLHDARCFMPYLVQVLLPVYDNEGGRFPIDYYDEVRVKLTDLFGGLTAYTRAPAEFSAARVEERACGRDYRPGMPCAGEFVEHFAASGAARAGIRQTRPERISSANETNAVDACR